MVDKKVMLNIGEVMIELGVKFLIIGIDVIDVSILGFKGYFIFDSGFIFIVFCELKIIFIDGDKGILLYCGYFID